MSNQILIDLYKEASEFAYKICKEEGRAGGPTDHIWNTLSTGRFAELIVQECISKIDAVGYKASNNISSDDTELFKSVLKSHFGVE